MDYELTAAIVLGQLKFKSRIISQVADEDEEDDLKVRWPGQTEIEKGEEQCSLIKACD